MDVKQETNFQGNLDVSNAETFQLPTIICIAKLNPN